MFALSHSIHIIRNLQPSLQNIFQIIASCFKTKQPKKDQKRQKNSLCASRILLPEFTFSKTQNIFTNFRLSYFKGSPLFEKICQSALLEKVDFDTCFKSLTLARDSQIEFSGFGGRVENGIFRFRPLRGQPLQIQKKVPPNWR